MVDMDVLPTLHHSSANSAESNLHAGEVDDSLAMVMCERGETSESSSSPSYNRVCHFLFECVVRSHLIMNVKQRSH